MRWPAPRPLHAWRALAVTAITCLAPTAEAGIIDTASTMSVSANLRGTIDTSSFVLDTIEPNPATIQAVLEGFGAVESEARGWVNSRLDGQAAGGGAEFTSSFTKVGSRRGGGGYYLPTGGIRQAFTIDTPASVFLAMASVSESISESFGSHPFGNAGFTIVRTSDDRLVYRDEQLTSSGGAARVELPAGEYELVITVPFDGTSWSSRSVATGFAVTAVLWGVGALPGSMPDFPILPTSITVADSTNPGGFDFDVITSDEIVFYDPEVATGYDYRTEDAAFASVLIPEALPGGDDAFDLIVGQDTFVLNAGDIFDFTQFFTGGVREFSIRGIDPGAALDPSDPLAFVTGLSFVEANRPASFRMTPVSQAASHVTPEPGSLALLATGGIGLVGGWFRRRRNPSRDNSAAA